MAEVASRPHAHPVGIVRRESEDSVDKELDWLIQKEKQYNYSDEDDLHIESKASQEQPSSASFRVVQPRSPRSSPRGSPRSPPPPPSDDEQIPSRPKSRQGDGDDDEYPEMFDMSDLSDDQRQAMMELQNMKLDLGYTTDEEPPEYDVTERLRQLNAELAQEPTPSDDDRERAIKFEENPVSLVIPPQDYNEDEEEISSPPKDTVVSEVVDMEECAQMDSDRSFQEPQSVHDEKKDDAIIDQVAAEQQAIETSEEQNDSYHDVVEPKQVEIEPHADHGEKEVSHDDDNDEAHEEESHNLQQADDEQKQQGMDNSDRGMETLAELTGDRETDKEPFEEELDDDDDDNDDQKEEEPYKETKHSDNHSHTSYDDDNDGDKVIVERNGKFEHVSVKNMSAEERELYGVDEDPHKPHPPSAPRPSTANSGGSSTSGQRQGGRAGPRSSSAMQTRDEFTYQSPYALTKQQRKQMKQEYRDKEYQKHDEDRRRKEQEQRDKIDAEDAYHSWLQMKRQQAQDKRKRNEDGKNDQEKKEQDEDDDSSFQGDTEGAFREWLKVKKMQKKGAQDAEKRRLQEYDDGFYVRPRTECNKAFKEWLKKKNADLKKEKQEEMQKARVHKLLARKSRKSQQLAKAIKQAQAFRYVDYYGYRY